MQWLINPIRNFFRAIVREVAPWLDRVSGGRVTPNMVTIFGLLMHLPIAILIARGRFVWAAVLLGIFGLFDALDGELSRVQKRVSDVGGFLDAVTDRLKEVLLYSGAAFFLAGTDHPQTAVWAVLACGASLSVSYIKAKGEAIVAARGAGQAYTKLNKLFADGMMSFEVRMFVLILGLLVDQLLFAVAGIAILACFTALQRLILVAGRIKE